MAIEINTVEARILGSLLEKSLATPEYYPLSLNALINACNQKSSRDPVVNYDEATVQNALDHLCEIGVVFKSGLSRVPKYEEHFTRKYQMVPREIAVLCILLLRGPQTVGELKTRSTRMSSFESLQDVIATLDQLSEYGVAHQLPRMPGHKEPRYGQLLCREDEVVENDLKAMTEGTASGLIERIDEMALTIDDLRQELNQLKDAFADFKKQFED